LRQQNGSIFRTCVKREPVGRILPWIHKYIVEQWWERNCDTFIWKEAELKGKSVEDTREEIFYSERLSDQYEIFWVKFPEDFFHWKKRLQEAPEFQE
jgi:hypothetical protein